METDSFPRFIRTELYRSFSLDQAAKNKEKEVLKGACQTNVGSFFWDLIKHCFIICRFEGNLGSALYYYLIYTKSVAVKHFANSGRQGTYGLCSHVARAIHLHTCTSSQAASSSS